jgi:hypothetical protein
MWSSCATGAGHSSINSSNQFILQQALSSPSPSSDVFCRRFVANMGMCQFPLIAAKLAAAGISSFRFDHPCAIFSKSQRLGAFQMGNHREESEDMRAAVDFMRSRGKRVAALLGHR